MAPALPLAIGAAALGMHTANKQKKAAKSAAEGQSRAAQQAQALLAPYVKGGKQASNIVQQEIETGKLGGSFEPGDLTQTPGYQFALEEGLRNLERQNAAKGNLYSGGALKEAQRYTTALADRTYDDAYNRWLQSQQNRYNVLSGQQRLGYGAAGGQGDVGVQSAEQQGAAKIARQNINAQGLAGILGAFQNPQSMLQRTQSGYGY